MCIILTSSKGKELKEEWLRTSWTSNPHGSGIMYAKEGKLFLEKGFFTFEEFYENYKKCIGYPHVIHHRWKTSGNRDKNNCHPFVIRSEIVEINDIKPDSKEKIKIENPLLAFAHNGVITGFSQATTSDTYNFNKEVLQGFDKHAINIDWWKNPELKKLVEIGLGSGNKIVLLDNNGHIEIFNSQCGKWIEEKTIWASNDSYEKVKQRPTSDWDEDERGCFHKKYNYTNNNTHVVTPKSSALPPQGQDNYGAQDDFRSDDSNKIIPINTPNTSGFEDFTKISPEELEEIDRYLEEINSVGELSSN